MIIKLNYDMIGFKKGSKVDIEKLQFKEKQYFLRRIKDSKIDNCIEIFDIKKEENQQKIIKNDKKEEKKELLIDNNNETKENNQIGG